MLPTKSNLHGALKIAPYTVSMGMYTESLIAQQAHPSTQVYFTTVFTEIPKLLHKFASYSEIHRIASCTNI